MVRGPDKLRISFDRRIDCVDFKRLSEINSIERERRLIKFD